MINSTTLINNIQNLTSQSDVIRETANVFIPSVATYWVLQFIITFIIGIVVVREDKGNFIAIFIFTQLLGAIALFFIFIFPVIPQLIDKFF